MNLQERKAPKGKSIPPSGEGGGAGADSKTIRVKPAARARPAGLNRSVTRALDLLLYVAHSPAPQSFVDLQKHHRVPKATLHKLLFTLEVLNFIRRDEDTGNIHLVWPRWRFPRPAPRAPPILP